MNWPDARLDSIHTREDLGLFLVELANRLRAGEVRLENPSSVDFINAAGRWTKSMDGFFQNIMHEPVPQDPDWALIAAIFSAAIIYE